MTRAKKKDGLFYDYKAGRVMEHKHYAVRIHWSQPMLDYFCKHFPTTTNEELAGCLNVSKKTVSVKAKELGLHKDPQWMRNVVIANGKVGHAVAKKMGYPGKFQKGVRFNPKDEFKKGHKLTEDQMRRRVEGIRRWCQTHPAEVRARMQKALETRRRNSAAKKLAAS